LSIIIEYVTNIATVHLCRVYSR